jgi:G:T/U-mismatch repair DNA glycosylase
MTPPKLATELGMSPKTLRAFLRREFPRSSADRGLEWLLTPEQVAAARAHFGQGELTPLGAPAPPAFRPTTSAQRMTNAGAALAPLRCYIRPKLDVLFVALNPPTKSANNGHWFSGEQSAFFKLLYMSGLITANVPKANADEIVFGGTSINYKAASYGVTDLRPELIETNSGNVRVSGEDVARFIDRVRANEPRIVCIIHGKVRAEFNRLVDRFPGVVATVEIEQFTTPLAGCTSRFICNHFPNGNSYPDAVKIEIFRRVWAAL